MNQGGFADKVIGGWQLQGITGFRSGIPYTPTVSRDVGEHRCRADSGPTASAPESSSNPTLNLYFDKNAFVVPAELYLGQFGRRHSSPRLPRAVRFLDSQGIHCDRSVPVPVPREVFNLPNTAYFSSPNSQMDMAAGGRVTRDAEQSPANAVWVEVQLLNPGGA